jgi:hypothetical protein
MVRSALVALVALSLCGCDGVRLDLGSSSPLLTGGDGGASGSAGGGSLAASGNSAGGPRREWSEPIQPFTQEAGVLFSNATLTEDELELIYTQELQGDDKPVSLHQRSREILGGAWSSAIELNLASDVSSPALSPGGELLWFGQNADGGLGQTDIWQSRREGSAWSIPEHLDAPLNSASDDVPRPPAIDGTLMPISSKRHGGTRYQIYLATRASADQPWQDVSRDLLGSVNSDEYESVDGFLAEGGLELYFSSTRNPGQRSDLFVARRDSLQAEFGQPVPLDVNTVADERDPWLSSDGRRLYFTSDRPSADYEQYAIYMSQRAR